MSSPSSSQRFKTHTVKPLASHTHTIIFLHDCGSDATEFALRLFDSHESATRLSLRDTFPSFKWIFPYAPTLSPVGNLPLGGNLSMAQWFNVLDVSHPQEGCDSQRQSLDRGTATLLQLVLKEIKEGGVSPNHIFLAGMGQGMALAAHALLRLDVSLAGLVGLNSWLPFQEKVHTLASGDDWDGTLTSIRALLGEPALEEQQNQTETSRQAGELQLETAVFLAHSRDDSIVPIVNGTAMRDTLSALGMNVEWHEYSRGGHWFNIPNGVDDFAAFLRKSIAKHYLLDKRLSRPVLPSQVLLPDGDGLKAVA